MTGVVERYKKITLTFDGLEFRRGQFWCYKGKAVDDMDYVEMRTAIREMAYQLLETKQALVDLKIKIGQMESEDGWKASYDHAQRTGGTM